LFTKGIDSRNSTAHSRSLIYTLSLSLPLSLSPQPIVVETWQATFHKGFATSYLLIRTSLVSCPLKLLPAWLLLRYALSYLILSTYLQHGSYYATPSPILNAPRTLHQKQGGVLEPSFSLAKKKPERRKKNKKQPFSGTSLGGGKLALGRHPKQAQKPVIIFSSIIN